MAGKCRLVPCEALWELLGKSGIWGRLKKQQYPRVYSMKLEVHKGVRSIFLIFFLLLFSLFCGAQVVGVLAHLASLGWLAAKSSIRARFPHCLL